VKRGVRKFPNHEPKWKPRSLMVVMPRSLRDIRAELKRRTKGSTRVTPGAFAKNARPRCEFDQRPTTGGRNADWKQYNAKWQAGWYRELAASDITESRTRAIRAGLVSAARAMARL
jgi:hypothetical protein